MVENQKLGIPICCSSTVVKVNWTHSTKNGVCTERGMEYCDSRVGGFSISDVSFFKQFMSNQIQSSMHLAQASQAKSIGRRLLMNDARVNSRVTQPSMCQRSTFARKRMTNESTAATVTIRLRAPRWSVTAVSHSADRDLSTSLLFFLFYCDKHDTVLLRCYSADLQRDDHF